MDAQEQVLNAMAQAGKALKAGELVDLTGLGRPEVDKVIKQLKKEEKIVSPKVCYWEPKK
jgi:predicted DNA-binding transcriptional regulator AlpA